MPAPELDLFLVCSLRLIADFCPLTCMEWKPCYKEKKK
jgi:hypothetical protein